MYAIGEASRLSGVGIEAIRYYEREGTVPKPDRAANGRRVYTDKGVARLRFLKRCRRLGFKLPEAKALLELSSAANADCHFASEFGRCHRESIRQKIAELRELQSALDELMENCATGNSACPMLEKLANS